jgi:CBS domain-containing protein
MFYGLSAGAAMAGLSGPVNGLIRYLAFINVLLAVFNLLPAYPLDGGRILRSALWGARGDLRWATRISSRLGAAFGLFLIVSGFYNAFFAGNFIAGLWWALIGIFLYGSAKMSYRQLLTSRALEGLSVRRFVNDDPVTVAPDITVEQIVNDFVYVSNNRVYPVVSGSDRVEGCVTTSTIRETPRGEWGSKRVRDIEAPCSADNTISPDEKALNALSQMSRSGVSQLMVVDNGRLAGIVSLRDIMNFLTLRIELDAA